MLLPPIYGLGFSHEVMMVWEDERWLENFWMTKGSFLKLVNLVRRVMSPSLDSRREPIPLEEKVGMALYTRSRKKVPAPEVGGQREPPDASPDSEVRRAAAAAIWGQVGSPGEWVSWRRPALH